MEQSNFPDTYLTDQQVLNKIWLEPRKVFRFLNQYKHDKYLILLLVLFGIQKALEKLSSSVNDGQSAILIIFISVFFGAIFGWIGQYIYAVFIRIAGNSLGGKADTRSILRVLAYSSIPVIFSLFCFVAKFVLLGNDIFLSDGSHLGKVAVFLNYSFIILEVILAVWSFVLCVVGIAEIQEFSLLKSLANLLLPFFIISAFVLFFLLLFKVITW